MTMMMVMIVRHFAIRLCRFCSIWSLKCVPVMPITNIRSSSNNSLMNSPLDENLSKTLAFKYPTHEYMCGWVVGCGCGCAGILYYLVRCLEDAYFTSQIFVISNTHNFLHQCTVRYLLCWLVHFSWDFLLQFWQCLPAFEFWSNK